jgi:hypothetical protein
MNMLSLGKNLSRRKVSDEYAKKERTTNMKHTEELEFLGPISLLWRI